MDLLYKDLSYQIRGAAYDVRKNYGPGHKEVLYQPDFIVDDKIIVEVKAVSDLMPAHEVQLVNYLKATGLHVGLLINFGQSVKVKRRIFGYDTDTD